MGKTARKRELKEMRKAERREHPRAILRYARIAPRKMRILANMVRGKDVEEALALLNFSNKRGALPLRKLIMSATFNAEQLGHDTDNLYIKTIYVDQGPMWKWRRPRARGRAFPIRKKTSHVTVILAEKKEA